MPCSHIDPEFPGVAGGGFRAPILHGLCTMGHTIRHVFKEYCGNDSSKFKGCAVRFSSPVIPGETVTPHALSHFVPHASVSSQSVQGRAHHQSCHYLQPARGAG